MGFLHVIYAVIFLGVAFAGYIFCHAMHKFMQFRWRVLFTILVFGASSYIGFIFVLLALWNSPLSFLLKGTFGTTTNVLAYVLPGIIGAWVCFKGMKTFRPST